jgi:hypothetical protein
VALNLRSMFSTGSTNLANRGAAAMIPRRPIVTL